MLTLAIAAAFMATSVPAWAAQMPQQTSEAAKEESSAAPVAAAEDDHALEDTVVTATRREKRDIDVPAATVVITGEAIKESGAADAADASERHSSSASSLTIQQAEIFIRHILSARSICSLYAITGVFAKKKNPSP